MAQVEVEELAAGGRGLRWDAEFYASPYREFLDSLFGGWPEWLPLGDREVTSRLSSGHTPADHDLGVGNGRLITIEAVDPLHLDPSRFRHVLRSHVAGELKRARVEAGDVVTTIKRRLLNSSPVIQLETAVACNQDVVVLTPTEKFLPGFVAAVLSSRIGKYQAFRNQTEQINPYLSIPNLSAVKVPVIPVDQQRAIHDLVIKRLEAFQACEASELAAEEVLANALGLHRITLPLKRSAVVSSASMSSLGRLDAEYFCFPDLDAEWRSPFPTFPLGDPRVSVAIANGATPAAKDYADDGVPIVKVGGITRYGLAEWRGDRVAASATTASGDRGRVKLDDILLLCAAHHVRYIGRAGLLRALPEGRTEARCVGELIGVRAGELVQPETLVTYLNLPPVRRQVQRLVRGQSAHLYPRDLTALPIPLVPAPVQDEVAEKLATAFAYRREAAALAESALKRVEGLVIAV